MTNYEIADHFSLLSQLMDIHGEDSFKAKSYASAAFNIENLPKEIEDMDDAELAMVRGIGKAIAEKIKEIRQTGKLPLLEKFMTITPPGVMEMLQIKGLGPKKIAVIWKELGVETIGELEYACNENRLAALKGFGAKTQESIARNIAYFRQNLGHHLWAEVAELADKLVMQLQQNMPRHSFSLTGDIRRQAETIEFIEIATDADRQNIVAQFQTIPDTVFEDLPDEILQVKVPQQPALKFYLTRPVDFYKTLFLTTGNDKFIAAFTQRFTIPYAVRDEEEIFASNNLPLIPPFLRETAGVLDNARHKFEDIISPGDIKGIIHSHSKWSDGVQTLEQMAQAAIEQGFEYLVISDHSQTAVYAGGLTPEKIAAQHQEIDALNDKIAPFKIFKGIESDILNDGSLDYPDKLLSTFDLVIASVHSNLKMTEEKAMERLLAVIRNPYTTILGHMTGRKLLAREGFPVNYKIIIDACAENDVAIEINANPRRLDMDWRWIPYAMEQGVLLSINPDAHSVSGFHDIYYGTIAARKGGLTPAYNLSSYGLKDFEVFLERYKRKKAQVQLY